MRTEKHWVVPAAMPLHLAERRLIGSDGHVSSCQWLHRRSRLRRPVRGACRACSWLPDRDLTGDGQGPNGGEIADGGFNPFAAPSSSRRLAFFEAAPGYDG